MNDIDDATIASRSRKHLVYNAIPFLACFLTFLISLLFANGWAVDPTTGVISVEPFKYLHNLLAMPVIAAMLLVGVLAVLWGIGTGIFKGSRKSIWFSGSGTVLTVLSLLLLAGFNNTAYYPSLSDMQSSLTIYNSSSSLFTLEAMSIVSIFIPFVVAYIWYSWRAMNRKPITRQEIESDDHLY